MKSNNLNILKSLIKKLNGIKTPVAQYIMIYTFLYKFCSDNLKDYYMMLIEDKEITLDEAFKNDKYLDIFKKEALYLYGYHFKKAEALIDEVINNNLNNKNFLSKFLNIFPENIIFENDNKDKQYFEFIFNSIDEAVDDEREIIEIILLISKLDIFEKDIPFDKVFETVILNMYDINPPHITQTLSSLISSQKNYIKNTYDPFIKDASSIIQLSKDCQLGLEKYYAKEENRLNYCIAIVNLFINNFNLNSLYLQQVNALNSADVEGMLFDVVVSRIPKTVIKNPDAIKNQSLEITRRNKRSEIEKILLKNFNLDDESFIDDYELKNALNNLISQIDNDDEIDLDLKGEFEDLKNSEYLFLLNIIDSINYDGIVALSLSESFLSDISLKTLRKYLICEKNYIDTIITLPVDIEKAKQQEIIIVFKKNRFKKDILFIDLSKDYEIKKSNFKYGKILFDDATIDKLKEVYLNKKEVDNFSYLFSIDEIAQNDFDLSFSRFCDDFIKLSDLKKEKEEIDSNISDLNFKIEKMMDDLNIDF